jgi:hypothetical protein
MGDAKTDHELRAMRWRDDDGVDEGDALHAHFQELEDRGEFEDWTDVGSEGSRMWGRMFDEDIELGSPADHVMSAVAASGFGLALKLVANRLGVTEFGIRCALEEPGDASEFLEKCRVHGAAAPAHVEKESE